MKPSLHRFGEVNRAVVSILLVAAVSWTFLPVLNNDFVNYDDQGYVYANPHVTGGLSWNNIGWAFTTFEMGAWHPVTWLSIMLDCQLFGVHAGYHHLTSLMIHALSTVLLFLFLSRTTGALWPSGFVAALFGLHPLHVESVAWAAERKDVLSGLFFMLTLYTYARFANGQLRETEQAQKGGTEAERVPRPPRQSGTGGWYIVSFTCFVLGLLSKPMLVTVPVVLLLLDWWPLHRFVWPGRRETVRIPTKHLVKEKLPFLAGALALGLLTIFSQNKIGALQPALQIPLRSRLANAVLSYAEYLAQTVWPTRLGAFYSLPQSFSVWSTVSILLAGGIILAIAFYSAQTRPFLAVGWLWYLVMLLPVIGLLQVGHQAHADRYTYLPLIGIFIMVSWGAYDLVGRYDVGRVLLPIVGIGIVALCIGLTRQQVRYWKDSETLWRHMLSLSWDNAVAHSHLGTILSQKGQRDAAIAEYREALRVAPGYALARIKLGVALAEKGDVDEAIFQLETAVKTAPNDLDAQYNLGVALMSQGRYEQALMHFQEALRIRPGYARAESNVQAIRALKASQLEHSQSGNR